MTNPKHTDTIRSGDLVERLRDSFEYDRSHYAPDPLVAEAADRIEALEAENERLREALAKIVALEDDFESNAAMTAHEWQVFHTARAALEGTSHE